MVVVGSGAVVRAVECRGKAVVVDRPGGCGGTTVRRGVLILGS